MAKVMTTQEYLTHNLPASDGPCRCEDCERFRFVQDCQEQAAEVMAEHRRNG